MSFFLLLFNHIIFYSTASLASAVPPEHHEASPHNIPESLEIQRNYSTADPLAEKPIVPGGGWTPQTTWAMGLLILFAVGFAAFIIVPMVRKRITKRIAARKAKNVAQEEKREAENSALGIQLGTQLAQTWIDTTTALDEKAPRSRSTASADREIYGDKRTFGNAYEGLTTPKLRSVSGRLKMDDVEGGKGPVRTVGELKGDTTRSSLDSDSELESLVASRLPEPPRPIVLKEIVPLPPIEM